MADINPAPGTGKCLALGWKIAVSAGLLLAALAGCTFTEPPTAPGTAKPAASAPETPLADPGRPVLAGTTVADSFGNVDFYVTVPGDTPARVSAAFGTSEVKLNEFNGIEPGTSLVPGTKLRLIPAPGPVLGAHGMATVDANGIPTTYVIEPGDTLDGITYRFGLTDEQLAEANKVPYVHEKGNTYFVRAGRVIRLQKNPVDSRSGTGTTVHNSFGQAIFYTSVAGDSLDSLGYKFRCATDQILLYNPSLAATEPLPAAAKVRLMPGELTIDGARGSFTADAEGIPLTYTTAPGDTEAQVAFRFNVTDLRAANRSLTVAAGTWYEFDDLPTGGLAPGQTISLALNRPINAPGR